MSRTYTFTLTYLHQDVAGLRRDLEQSVLQVPPGVRGTGATPAAHFPAEERHFDSRPMHPRSRLMHRRELLAVLVVDRTRVHAEAGVSVVRLLLHRVRRPHRYLFGGTKREMSFPVL